MLSFERVVAVAAMPKAIFDMGFSWRMYGLDCPPHLLKITG
jgi:hypothetical protein